MSEISEIQDYELGISPLGMILVVLSALVGLVIFLDPNSTTYDVAVGSVIVLGIALGFGSGLQRWRNEADLRKTLYLGLLGAAIVSVVVAIFSYVGAQYSTIDSTTIIILAVPPVFEELLFRAGVYLTIQRVTGTYIALVTQALLFAVYHFARNPDPLYFAVLFIGGIVFCLIFLLSKNLLSPILAHEIVNLRPVYMQILLSPLTIAVIGIAFFLLIYRRLRK